MRLMQQTYAIGVNRLLKNKFRIYSVQNMEDLGMTWNISQWCTKTALPKINETFQHGKIFFWFLYDVLVKEWWENSSMVNFPNILTWTVDVKPYYQAALNCVWYALWNIRFKMFMKVEDYIIFLCQFDCISLAIWKSWYLHYDWHSNIFHNINRRCS